MSNLSLEEKETHFNQTADDRSVWEVASNDPVWILKLERASATLIRQRGETKFFTIPASQVTIRRKSSDVAKASRSAASRLSMNRLRTEMAVAK
jgi:hypothetical protein